MKFLPPKHRSIGQQHPLPYQPGPERPRFAKDVFIEYYNGLYRAPLGAVARIRYKAIRDDFLYTDVPGHGE